MKEFFLTSLIAIQGLLGIGGQPAEMPKNEPNFGLAVMTAPQGGTGIGSVTAGDIGKCLTVSNNLPFTFTVSSCAAGTGDITGGASLGTGLNIFDSKSGSTLRFNSLAAGSNITLSTSTDNNTIVISSTGGSAFPFTPQTWGVSTSTTIGLLNGFLSTASSTQSGNFFLPALSQGILYTGTNGLVNTAASSSIFGFIPISNQLTKGYFLVGDDSGVAQATSSIFISSTGQIGIGNQSPSSKLQITQPTDDRFGGIFLTESTGNYSSAIFRNAGDKGPLILRSQSVDTLFALEGRAGVSTSTPWGQLSVTNAGSNPSLVVEDTASPDSSPFLIDASGNVGIGTAAPSSKLEVNGDVKLTSDVDKITIANGTTIQNTLDADNGYIRTIFGSNVDWDSAANVWNVRNNGGADYGALYIDNGSGLGYVNETGLTLPTTRTNTQFLAATKLYITTAGAVGIGTTSPSGLLNVEGTSGNLLNLTNNGASKFYITSAGTVIAQSSILSVTTVQGGNGRVFMGPGLTDGNNGALYSASNKSLELLVDATAGRGMIIEKTSGNVGIGTTGPNVALQVVGYIQAGSSAYADQGFGIGINGAGSRALYWSRATDSGNQSWAFGDGAGDADAGTFGIANFSVTTAPALAISTIGNVGIGTTTPNHKLVSTSATGPQLSLSAGAGLNQWVMRNEGGELAFATSTYTATSSVSALRIDSNGKVRANCFTNDGTTCITSGATVAGSDTQVQFNDGGSALGGDSGLVFNKTNDTLTTVNASTTRLSASSYATIGTTTRSGVSPLTIGTSDGAGDYVTITGDSNRADFGLNIIDKLLNLTLFSIDRTGLFYTDATTGNNLAKLYRNNDGNTGGALELYDATLNQLYFSIVPSFVSFEQGISDVQFSSAGGIHSVFKNQEGRFGFGTTTPTHLLTLATTTTPQLSLSGGAGVSQWTMRNAGGNLYFATTSVAGTATSTTAAIRVDTNGAVYLNNLRTSTAGNAICYLAGNELVVSGGTTCATSALKGKTDIEDITKEQALGVLDMKPVEYTLKENGQRRYGFIADWIKDEKLVEYTPDGEINGFDYLRYTALLTKLVQEQQKQIDNIVVGVVDTAQEKWQWGAIIALFGLIAYQQIQIRKIKKSFNK